MWQSPPCKSGQPYADTCHNPLLTKMINQILPRHHLTHETLILISLLSYHHHGSRRPPFMDLTVNRSTTIVPKASLMPENAVAHTIFNLYLRAPPTCSRSTTAARFHATPPWERESWRWRTSLADHRNWTTTPAQPLQHAFMSTTFAAELIFTTTPPSSIISNYESALQQ